MNQRVMSIGLCLTIAGTMLHLGCGGTGAGNDGAVGSESGGQGGKVEYTGGTGVGGLIGSGGSTASNGHSGANSSTIGGATTSVGSTSGGGVKSTGGSTANGGAVGGASAIGNGGSPTVGGSPLEGGSGGKSGSANNGGSSILGGSGGKSGSTVSGGTSIGAGGKATGWESAGSTSVGGAAVGGLSAGGASGDTPLVYDTENTGADCTVATTFPAFGALTAVANLPDPFKMADGTTITTKADWRCRRAEISSLMQHWESGPKGAPPNSLTATYSGGKLTVVATQGSTSITLSATITTPSGAGPFPVLISMDGSGVPSSIFSSRGIATMSFTSSQLVPSSMNVTRGAGTYFTLYPDTNAGAMIEWAWGVSRIIDGLYKTADQNKIDVKHIAVTGCSYAGKMALYAGAFDERIALTIPEESGGGGEASWRVMASQTGTEDLEAAQGTAWYASNLKQFKNADAPKLPIDMHELVAMIAPRAFLSIGNTSIDRLGSQAGYVSMKAAAEVYKALGAPDRIGWSQNATGTHCAFPSVQTADVAAFVDKFMLGKTSTPVAKTPYTTDMTKWITWTTPALK